MCVRPHTHYLCRDKYLVMTVRELVIALRDLALNVGAKVFTKRSAIIMLKALMGVAGLALLVMTVMSWDLEDWGDWVNTNIYGLLSLPLGAVAGYLLRHHLPPSTTAQLERESS